MRSSVVLLATALATVWSLQALADPPAHAPAHGWRKKHDPTYVGYTGTTWDHDYDVLSGHCNHEAVGAVLGARIGRTVDAGDRGCIGHALEMGTVGRTVIWANSATGLRYEVTPG